MKRLPITFPVMVLGPDNGRYGRPGRENVSSCSSQENFCYVEPWDSLRLTPSENLVVDTTGKAWRITKVADRDIFQTILRIVFRSYHRVRYEVVEAAAPSFEDIRSRACRSVQTHPDYWRADKTKMDEPLSDAEQAQLDKIIGRLGRAATFAQLIETIRRNL